MNQKMSISQNERVKDYLELHGSITPLEALEKIGTMRLGARIYNLKALGLNIKSEMVDVVNRFGKVVKVARYSLIKNGKLF